MLGSFWVFLMLIYVLNFNGFYTFVKKFLAYFEILDFTVSQFVGMSSWSVFIIVCGDFILPLIPFLLTIILHEIWLQFFFTAYFEHEVSFPTLFKWGRSKKIDFPLFQESFCCFCKATRKEKKKKEEEEIDLFQRSTSHCPPL